MTQEYAVQSGGRKQIFFFEMIIWLIVSSDSVVMIRWQSDVLIN